MPIRECTVVAVEGTNASGKTTLVHGLTSHFRERGVHAACTGEPARLSPLIEDIVLHRIGEFDLAAEVDLFGAQLTTQIRAARHYSLLFTDKTLANVVAHARLLLGPEDTAALAAMSQLCATLTGFYDAVYYCADVFSPDQDGDLLRAKVAGRQREIDFALRATCADIGLPLVCVPRGLRTEERVAWISEHLAARGLLPALA